MLPEPNIRSNGFTLIELLMTIVVIAILATVAMTNFIDFGRDARTAITQEKLKALKIAILGDSRFIAGGVNTKPGYEANCGGPPTVIADLVTMPGAGICSVVYNPFSRIGWNGPYVDASDPNWLNDAWGTPIEYFVPPDRYIRSCGPDAVCGGGNAADDIIVYF